jgi:hypothetical protein
MWRKLPTREFIEPIGVGFYPPIAKGKSLSLVTTAEYPSTEI